MERPAAILQALRPRIQRDDRAKPCTGRLTAAGQAPLDDGSADVVVSSFAFQHLRSRLAALREAYRVCVPGASLPSSPGSPPTHRSSRGTSTRRCSTTSNSLGRRPGRSIGCSAARHPRPHSSDARASPDRGGGGVAEDVERDRLIQSPGAALRWAASISVAAPRGGMRQPTRRQSVADPATAARAARP